MIFTIPTVNYLSSQSQSVGVGLGIVIGPAQFFGMPTANYQQLQNPEIEIPGIVVVPTPTINPDLPTGIDQYDIVFPPSIDRNNLEDLLTVSVANLFYVPGLPGEMQPGTFIFDEATQTLTIYSSQDNAPFTGQAIEYIAIESKRIVYGNDYRGATPQFFRDWGVHGEAVFERSLEQPSSGSLQFLMNHGTFRPCDLPEGTLIVWDGNGYAVGSVSASWNPIADGLMSVTVSLQGPHDHLTDKQVRYRGGTYGVSSGLSGGDDDPKSKVSIALSSICNRGGLKFFGPDPIIQIDKDRNVRDSTTINSELGRSRSVESFVNLSNPNGIEFREWFSQPTHNISQSEILNGSNGDSETPITITYNVSGNCWNGIKLAVEYLNTQLTLDDAEGGDVTEGNGRVNTVVKIRTGNGLPPFGGGGEVFRPPSNVDRSVPTNAFDLGGPTREITERTYFNSTLIAQTTRRKGYVYHCGNYSFPILANYEWFDRETGRPATVPEGGDSTGLVSMPTTFGNSVDIKGKGIGGVSYDRWEDVSNESEQYEFDSDDYLIKIIRTIETKRRFKQETEARETLILEGQKVLLNYWASVFDSRSEFTLNGRFISVIPWVTPDPDSEIDPNEGLNSNYQKLLDAINGDLSQYDYFSTTETDLTEYELDSLEGIYPDIPPKEQGEPDRKYVKSMRRVHQAKYETMDLSIEVPDKLLTIQTGEDKDHTEDVTIVYPTGNTQKSTYNSLRDLYVVSRSYKRSSGENFKHVYAEPSEYEEILGRPPQAQRREVFEDGNNPVEPTDTEEDSSILLLNTPNNGLSTKSDAIDGSIQFASARTKSKALSAAICDISIRNTQVVEVWSDVMVIPNRQYQCGERIRYQGQTYRILSVSDRISIESRNSIKRDVLRLSWGREVDLRNNVNLSEVDIDNGTANNS